MAESKPSLPQFGDEYDGHKQRVLVEELTRWAESLTFQIAVLSPVSNEDASLRSDLAASSGSTLVGYQSILALSVARNIEGKLGDVLSLLDFGAVGDDVADDSVAVQTAIDAGDVWVPPGAFRVPGGVTVPADRCVYGTGYQSQLKTVTLADNTVTITGSNATLRGLRITAGGKPFESGNREVGNSIYAHGVDVATRISNVTIERCFLEDGQSALNADWVDNIKVIGNFCTNTNAGFVQLNFWQCENGTVTGNTCDGGGLMTNNIGLIGLTAGTKSNGFKIANNGCLDCRFEAIQIMGSRNKVIANTISNDGSLVTQMGIEIITRGLLDDSQDNVVALNTIDGPSIGIHIKDFDNDAGRGPKNTMLLGNNLSNLKGQGYLVRNASDGTKINGGTVDGVLTTFGTGDGINIQSDNVQCDLVTVKNCALNGVKINGARSDCSASFNTIEDCLGDGIEDLGGTRTKIIGNTLNNNGGWGVSTGLATVLPIVENNTGTGNALGLQNVRFTVLAASATPSVEGGKRFVTGAAGVISNFVGGSRGQEIIVISNHAATYDTTGTNLSGSSVDIVTAVGDVTRWLMSDDATTWKLLEFVDVSADNSGGA